MSAKVRAAVVHWDKALALDYCGKLFRKYEVPAYAVSAINHETKLLNLAIDRCEAEYLWLMTPDVKLLYDDTLYSLMEVLDGEPKVGVVLPNRQNDRYLGGRMPYRKYLADGTAMLYRMSVGARFDEEFIFTGWSDLDFGLEVQRRDHQVWVDPRTAVEKEETTYGSWSTFRSAYNARNRLLLEAKWCWTPPGHWSGVDDYNDRCNPKKRIPTMFELAWWGEEKLLEFSQSVNHEHPQILIANRQGCGNEGWRLGD